MNSDSALCLVLDALDELRIPYMIVGSFSTNFYGIPRSTQDADIVVQLPPGAIASLANRLQPTFRLDPQMSFETITATKRYVLHLADEAFVFSVELFLLSEDAHDQQRFARRRCERIASRDIFIPSAEDAIITKIRWSCAGGRRKDLEDVENVIAVQGDRIDWAYVNSWCDRHGTRELLERIRESLSAKCRELQ